MARVENQVFCDRCGVEITWTPVFVPKKGKRRKEYCCQVCAQGLSCQCSERMFLGEEERRSTGR